MEALIQCILEMSAPIKKSLINSFANSPFVDAIAFVKISRKFSFPNIKQYDGMTDPDDHIAQYHQRMFMAAIPRDQWEAYMCKGFGSNLKKLTKYLCKTMEDVTAKAWAQIKWEDDEVNYSPSTRSRNDKRRCRHVECKSAERRPEPYLTSRQNDRLCDNCALRNRPPHQPERTRARVLEYNLSITPTEAVAAMKNLGNLVKWPERMSSPTEKRDSTKWCNFHRDHGHRVKDCIVLKFSGWSSS
ncbi:hypothetical protein ACOSQ2_025328 [Xanthoceras sorbifolium]